MVKIDMREAGTCDGNGYPKSEIRWIFAPLGHGSSSDLVPMGPLMGLILDPPGLRAWV